MKHELEFNQKIILGLTFFLMKESRKNYIAYVIKKSKDNLEFTYENSVKKVVTVFASSKYIHINFAGRSSAKYERTKDGIIDAKRDLLEYIL